MYKILSKIHTISNDIYEIYTILNDQGEKVEYGVATLEEARDKAKKILCKEGYCDLKIVEDSEYDIDIKDKEVQPAELLYTVNFAMDEDSKDKCVITPEKIENIKKDASINVGLQFNEIIPSFHFTIDGQDCSAGIPDWITFEPLSATSGILYLNGITQNHNIVMTID